MPFMEGVNLKKHFADAFPALDVQVEDSTWSLALAEKWFGKARSVDNFVLADLDIGIGCAIISEGRFHYGASFSAGELGYTLVGLDSRHPVREGAKYLVDIAAIRAIERNALERFDKPLGFAKILSLLNDGDPLALGLIEDAGYYLGIGLGNMANLLNPSHIIIAGDLSKAGPALFNAISAAMRECVLPSTYKALTITQGALGDDGRALGAAAFVLKRIFELEGLEQ